jgi:hypothetical protein
MLVITILASEVTAGYASPNVVVRTEQGQAK